MICALARFPCIVISCVALAGVSLARADDCRRPQQPLIPDGATASREAMINGQQAVKAFQSENMDYMKCLEQGFGAAEAAVKRTADPAEKALAESAYAEAIEAYNQAVSAEEAVAGAFNIELREYKAAHR